MGGFSGIPKIASQFDALGNRIGRTSGELKKVAEDSFKALENIGKVQKAAESAGSQLAKLNKELEKSGAHAEQGSLAGSEAGAMTGVTVMRGSQGLAPGESFTPEQLGKRFSPETGGLQYAELIEDLAKRIEKIMGPDNYMAKLLQVELPYLRSGARSSQEASAFLQNNLLAWMAGLQRELADPRTTTEMRNLILELIHLAQTGDAYMKDITGSQKEQEKAMQRIRDRQDKADEFVENIGKAVTKVQDQTKHGEDVYSVVQGIGNSYGALAKSAASIEQNSKNVTSRLEGLGNSYGTLASATVRLAQDSKHVVARLEATKSEIMSGVSESHKKITETAAEIKKANQALIDEMNRGTNELKRQMKEDADKAKKEAEESRKAMLRFGDDLLRGGGFGRFGGGAVALSDDFERSLLSHGG